MTPFFKIVGFNFACVFSALVFSNIARAVDWIAPTAEELAATSSAIDPEAGAEILYRYKQIDDSEYGSPSTDEYIRIKIFNEKGVKQIDKIDIHYKQSEQRIYQLQARVIKPDGRIINVEKNAFYDRDVVKANDVKVRARSFSFPQLEPGDIAEYQWNLGGDTNILAAKFLFLGEIPTRLAIFRVKPAPLVDGYKTMAYYYKCQEQKMQVSKDGFNYLEMKNLPAFVSEPSMDPEEDVQPWILFYPVKDGQKPEAFWGEVAKTANARAERYAKKPSKLVVETAAGIVANAATAAEKVTRINDYCRANILNYWVYIPKGGMDEKIAKKYDRSPDDLIKTKLGNSKDIPVLFVALARAQGIEARLALCSNRSDGAFKMGLPIEYYLNEIFVAVKIDEKWELFDPAHNWVTTNSLRWANEGVPAMIAMPKEPIWVMTGQTTAAKSVVNRKATLRLNDEGTLLGDIRIEYSGQSEITSRFRYHNETDQKVEEMVRESVQARLPNAELSDMRVTNTDDVLKPLVLSYSIKIPGYAERTGQRMFLQPNFFAKGESARFTAAERKHGMFFRYGETYKDDVSISLPAGFRLEEGSSPNNLGPGNWGHYNVMIGFKKSTNAIIYKREFVFTPLVVKAEGYSVVKQIFDNVHERDSHTLTLRQGE